MRKGTKPRWFLSQTEWNVNLYHLSLYYTHVRPFGLQIRAPRSKCADPGAIWRVRWRDVIIVNTELNTCSYSTTITNVTSGNITCSNSALRTITTHDDMCSEPGPHRTASKRILAYRFLHTHLVTPFADSMIPRIDTDSARGLDPANSRMRFTRKSTSSCDSI